MSIDRMRVAAVDKLAELGYAYVQGTWVPSAVSLAPPGVNPVSPPIAPRQTRQDFVTDLSYALADLQTVMYRHGFRRDILKRIVIPIADEQRFVSAVRGSYAYGQLIYSGAGGSGQPGAICTVNGVKFGIA